MSCSVTILHLIIEEQNMCPDTREQTSPYSYYKGINGLKATFPRQIPTKAMLWRRVKCPALAFRIVLSTISTLGYRWNADAYRYWG